MKARRSENDEAIEGILAVDKPRGWTSHDVIDALRRALGTSRVGHAGTLDPLATGVLVCAVGRATRALRFLDAGEKEYLATIRLGFETDTADADGTPLGPEAAETGTISREAFEAALVSFRGLIVQRPPEVSAIKVDGVPLHRRVRRGETVSAPPRQVTVFVLETVSFAAPAATLRLVTSAGTYVRAIVRDVGRALGVGAHVTALRRTRSGIYGHAEAVASRVDAPRRGDAFDAGQLRAALVPVARSLGHLPSIEAWDDEATGITHGRLAARIAARLEAGPPGAVRLLSPVGELLAIALAGAAAGDAAGPRAGLACVLARPPGRARDAEIPGALSPCA